MLGSVRHRSHVLEVRMLICYGIGEVGSIGYRRQYAALHPLKMGFDVRFVGNPNPI
jgi:hypothetical protein